MKNSINGLSGAFLYLAVIIGVPVVTGVLLTRSNSDTGLILPVWAAVLFAVFTPLAIIAIRTQVRVTRVRLIDLFSRSFYNRPALGKGAGHGNVSFEFVKGKYLVDLNKPLGEATIDDVPRFPMLLQADWMLLFCALPYMVLSGFGIFILFSPAQLLTETGSLGHWLPPSILSVGGLGADIAKDPAKLQVFHANILTVASMAFAGAYFFTLRLFLRAVVVFDLSTVTFLRAFAHMILSVILAIVVYRVVPSAETIGSMASSSVNWIAPAADAANPAAPVLERVSTDGVGALWLLIAFSFGFLPDAALSYLLQKGGLPFKDRHTALEKHTKVNPVTLLDGIDHVIAFRLEEANIYDVQNLATFNPIMLHVESPYGIYNAIDWVAQAQLCTVVGPERFLALKTLNVRTIFDLERAVLTEPDPLLADAIGELLLQDDARDASLRKLIGMERLPALQAKVEANGPITADMRRAALTKLTAVILDDLHVRRLRQIWNDIDAELGTCLRCGTHLGSGHPRLVEKV